MGLYYAWASPDYLLEMPFLQLLAYWDELNRILGGDEGDKHKDQGPDRAAFYRRYGPMIKRGDPP